MAGRRPDFLIGGASKAGTTSLFAWLNSHPDVAMPRTKELRFFDVQYGRGLDWYLAHFERLDAPLVGEASPRYLTHPDAAARIARDLPDTKVIFSLRDPVSRAYSDYIKDRDRQRAPDTFEAALEDPDLWARYVGSGEYHRHLRRFLDDLGPARVFVTLLDDLEHRPESQFIDLCAFIGARPLLTPTVGARVNARVAFRSLTARRVAKRLPRPIGKAIDHLNVRRVPYPTMATATERRLRGHFAPHDVALEQLLDRALPWGTS